MKSLAAALAAVSLASFASLPPLRPPAELRQTLQRYHRGSGAAPRQLTPVERAELRRQVMESAAPPPGTPAPPRRR
jgi:hypothetical protein